MNFDTLKHNDGLKSKFLKGAEAELDRLAKEAGLAPAEKTKRLAYLKGVLHDIFLENR